MAEQSGFWTTDDSTPVGHQVASYTDVIAAKAWAILASCGGKEGVSPSYLSYLAPSSTGDNNVRIAPGGAVVDGQWYENGASEDFNIPSAVGGGNTRIDRVVLKCTWADFDVVLEVVPGSDNAVPVAPSLTQTPGTEYDIQICQVLVNTSGNITITDERTWAIVGTDGSTLEAANLLTESARVLRVKDGGITAAKMANGAIDATAKLADSVVTAAKIANRTRKFLVAPHFDGATQAYTVLGALLNDGEGNSANGYFYVPSDYVSGMTIKASVLCGSSGNMYSAHLAYYHAVGEDWNTHSATITYAAVALTADQRAEVQSLSLASVAAGDYVGVYLIRDATHVSDTLSDDVHIIGFIVEYTADS